MFWVIYRAMILSHQVFQWGFLSKKGACCWSRKSGVFPAVFPGTWIWWIWWPMTCTVHGKIVLVAWHLYTPRRKICNSQVGKISWKFLGGFFVGFIPEFHLMGGNSGEFIEYIEKSWKMHHVCWYLIYCISYQEKWRFLVVFGLCLPEGLGSLGNECR